MASGTGTAFVIIHGHSFADARIRGLGDECYLFGDGADNGHVFADTSAFTSKPTKGSFVDCLSLQLICENTSTNVPIGASDTSVVASTKTFTIPGYTFTGQVGATIHVRGDVAHAGNNGDFVVSSVTSAHVVVCTTASGLSNETFNPATTTITVERTDAPLIGTWKVEVSNDNTSASTSTQYGQVAGADGKWSDITIAFSPSIVAVTDAASQNQFIQTNICTRALRVTFTPTP